MKRRLVILLTACLLFTGGLVRNAVADRLSDAENLVGQLIIELIEIEAKGNSLSEEARKMRFPI